MILNILQTKTNFDMEWRIESNNQPILLASAPFVKGKFEVNIQSALLPEVRLYFNPSDTTWGSKLIDRLSFKILNGTDKIGSLVGQTKKVGFLKSYPYYLICYNGSTYYGYEVGFGAKGLYLCVYKDAHLIAIVDKKLRVVNFKDTYTAYLEDDHETLIVSLFVIYYDVTAYGDLMEIAVHSTNEKRVNTFQKELLAKYDPAFIPRIKAMEAKRLS